jgi:branched-chain amino acid transport system substrate-binding protein
VQYAFRRPILIFVPFVQRISDAKPDVVFFWVPSTQATALMKAVRDLGLREAGTHLTSTQDLLPDEQLPAIGDVALDLITAGNYSTAGRRPANEAFLAAWKRAYADTAVPNFLTVHGTKSCSRNRHSGMPHRGRPGTYEH